MQRVGCALIQNIHCARQSLPAGFVRKDPAPTSHLLLIMLADLLRDLSRPENREDSDQVGSDTSLILTSEGDLATRTSVSHSRLFRRKQIGRGKFSPLMAFDEAFGEWDSRTGDCRPPALVPPGRGLAADAATAQVVTDIMILEHRGGDPRGRRRTRRHGLSGY